MASRGQQGAVGEGRTKSRTPTKMNLKSTPDGSSSPATIAAKEPVAPPKRKALQSDTAERNGRDGTSIPTKLIINRSSTPCPSSDSSCPRSDSSCPQSRAWRPESNRLGIFEKLEKIRKDSPHRETDEPESAAQASEDGAILEEDRSQDASIQQHESPSARNDEDLSKFKRRSRKSAAGDSLLERNGTSSRSCSASPCSELSRSSTSYRVSPGRDRLSGEESEASNSSKNPLHRSSKPLKLRKNSLERPASTPGWKSKGKRPWSRRCSTDSAPSDLEHALAHSENNGVHKSTGQHPDGTNSDDSEQSGGPLRVHGSLSAALQNLPTTRGQRHAVVSLPKVDMQPQETKLIKPSFNRGDSLNSEESINMDNSEEVKDSLTVVKPGKTAQKSVSYASRSSCLPINEQEHTTNVEKDSTPVAASSEHVMNDKANSSSAKTAKNLWDSLAGSGISSSPVKYTAVKSPKGSIELENSIAVRNLSDPPKRDIPEEMPSTLPAVNEVQSEESTKKAKESEVVGSKGAVEVLSAKTDETDASSSLPESGGKELAKEDGNNESDKTQDDSSIKKSDDDISKTKNAKKRNEEDGVTENVAENKDFTEKEVDREENSVDIDTAKTTKKVDKGNVLKSAVKKADDVEELVSSKTDLSSPKESESGANAKAKDKQKKLEVKKDKDTTSTKGEKSEISKTRSPVKTTKRAGGTSTPSPKRQSHEKTIVTSQRNRSIEVKRRQKSVVGISPIVQGKEVKTKENCQATDKIDTEKDKGITRKEESTKEETEIKMEKRSKKRGIIKRRGSVPTLSDKMDTLIQSCLKSNTASVTETINVPRCSPRARKQTAIAEDYFASRKAKSLAHSKSADERTEKKVGEEHGPEASNGSIVFNRAKTKRTYSDVNKPSPSNSPDREKAEAVSDVKNATKLQQEGEKVLTGEVKVKKRLGRPPKSSYIDQTSPKSTVSPKTSSLAKTSKLKRSRNSFAATSVSHSTPDESRGQSEPPQDIKEQKIACPKPSEEDENKAEAGKKAGNEECQTVPHSPIKDTKGNKVSKDSPRNSLSENKKLTTSPVKDSKEPRLKSALPKGTKKATTKKETANHTAQHKAQVRCSPAYNHDFMMKLCMIESRRWKQIDPEDLKILEKIDIDVVYAGTEQMSAMEMEKENQKLVQISNIQSEKVDASDTFNSNKKQKVPSLPSDVLKSVRPNDLALDSLPKVADIDQIVSPSLLNDIDIDVVLAGTKDLKTKKGKLKVMAEGSDDEGTVDDAASSENVLIQSPVRSRSGRAIKLTSAAIEAGLAHESTMSFLVGAAGGKEKMKSGRCLDFSPDHSCSSRDTSPDKVQIQVSEIKVKKLGRPPKKESHTHSQAAATNEKGPPKLANASEKGSNNVNIEKLPPTLSPQSLSPDIPRIRKKSPARKRTIREILNITEEDLSVEMPPLAKTHDHLNKSNSPASTRAGSVSDKEQYPSKVAENDHMHPPPFDKKPENEPIPNISESVQQNNQPDEVKMTDGSTREKTPKACSTIKKESYVKEDKDQLESRSDNILKENSSHHSKESGEKGTDDTPDKLNKGESTVVEKTEMKDDVTATPEKSSPRCDDYTPVKFIASDGKKNPSLFSLISQINDHINPDNSLLPPIDRPPTDGDGESPDLSRPESEFTSPEKSTRDSSSEEEEESEDGSGESDEESEEESRSSGSVSKEIEKGSGKEPESPEKEACNNEPVNTSLDEERNSSLQGDRETLEKEAENLDDEMENTSDTMLELSLPQSPGCSSSGEQETDDGIAGPSVSVLGKSNDINTSQECRTKAEGSAENSPGHSTNDFCLEDPEERLRFLEAQLKQLDCFITTKVESELKLDKKNDKSSSEEPEEYRADLSKLQVEEDEDGPEREVTMRTETGEVLTVYGAAASSSRSYNDSSEENPHAVFEMPGSESKKKASAFLSNELDEYLTKNNKLNQKCPGNLKQPTQTPRPSAEEKLASSAIPDVDIVDDLVFYSFSTQSALEDYVQQGKCPPELAEETSATSRITMPKLKSQKPIEPIPSSSIEPPNLLEECKTPEKTLDITKIKGWKKKFNPGEEPPTSDPPTSDPPRLSPARVCGPTVSPTPEGAINSLMKIHWRTKERLLRKLTQDEILALGLNLKQRRRKTKQFTHRKKKNRKVNKLLSGEKVGENTDGRMKPPVMPAKKRLRPTVLTHGMVMNAVSALRFFPGSKKPQQRCQKETCEHVCICQNSDSSDPTLVDSDNISYTSQDASSLPACGKEYCRLGCLCNLIEEAKFGSPDDYHADVHPEVPKAELTSPANSHQSIGVSHQIDKKPPGTKRGRKRKLLFNNDSEFVPFGLKKRVTKIEPEDVKPNLAELQKKLLESASDKTDVKTETAVSPGAEADDEPSQGSYLSMFGLGKKSDIKLAREEAEKAAAAAGKVRKSSRLKDRTGIGHIDKLNDLIYFDPTQWLDKGGKKKGKKGEKETPTWQLKPRPFDGHRSNKIGVHQSRWGSSYTNGPTGKVRMVGKQREETELLRVQAPELASKLHPMGLMKSRPILQQVNPIVVSDDDVQSDEAGNDAPETMVAARTSLYHYTRKHPMLSKKQQELRQRKLSGQHSRSNSNDNEKGAWSTKTKPRSRSATPTASVEQNSNLPLGSAANPVTISEEKSDPTASKIRKQMVLLQRNHAKRPTPPSMIEIKPDGDDKPPHLLEIQSDCNWHSIRSHLLNQISIIADRDDLPPFGHKLCRKIGDFIIEIRPPSKEGTPLPPNLQTKTCRSLPAIRIMITMDIKSVAAKTLEKNRQTALKQQAPPKLHRIYPNDMPVPCNGKMPTLVDGKFLPQVKAQPSTTSQSQMPAAQNPVLTKPGITIPVTNQLGLSGLSRLNIKAPGCVRRGEGSYSVSRQRSTSLDGISGGLQSGQHSSAMPQQQRSTQGTDLSEFQNLSDVLKNQSSQSMDIRNLSDVLSHARMPGKRKRSPSDDSGTAKSTYSTDQAGNRVPVKAVDDNGEQINSKEQTPTLLRSTSLDSSPRSIDLPGVILQPVLSQSSTHATTGVTVSGTSPAFRPVVNQIAPRFMKTYMTQASRPPIISPLMRRGPGPRVRLPGKANAEGGQVAFRAGAGNGPRIRIPLSMLQSPTSVSSASIATPSEPSKASQFTVQPGNGVRLSVPFTQMEHLNQQLPGQINSPLVTSIVTNSPSPSGGGVATIAASDPAKTTTNSPSVPSSLPRGYTADKNTAKSKVDTFQATFERAVLGMQCTEDNTASLISKPRHGFAPHDKTLAQHSEKLPAKSTLDLSVPSRRLKTDTLPMLEADEVQQEVTEAGEAESETSPETADKPVVVANASIVDSDLSQSNNAQSTAEPGERSEPELSRSVPVDNEVSELGYIDVSISDEGVDSAKPESGQQLKSEQEDQSASRDSPGDSDKHTVREPSENSGSETLNTENSQNPAEAQTQDRGSPVVVVSDEELEFSDVDVTSPEDEVPMSAAQQLRGTRDDKLEDRLQYLVSYNAHERVMVSKTPSSGRVQSSELRQHLVKTTSSRPGSSGSERGSRPNSRNGDRIQQRKRIKDKSRGDRVAHHAVTDQTLEKAELKVRQQQKDTDSQDGSYDSETGEDSSVIGAGYRDAEGKKLHIQRERLRRNDLSQRFEKLRLSFPDSWIKAGEKTSKFTILRAARKFIAHQKERECKLNQELQRLLEERTALIGRLKALKFAPYRHPDKPASTASDEQQPTRTHTKTGRPSLKRSKGQWGPACKRKPLLEVEPDKEESINISDCEPSAEEATPALTITSVCSLATADSEDAAEEFDVVDGCSDHEPQPSPMCSEEDGSNHSTPSVTQNPAEAD